MMSAPKFVIAVAWSIHTCGRQSWRTSSSMARPAWARVVA
jgi:hypothetical protein